MFLSAFIFHHKSNCWPLVGLRRCFATLNCIHSKNANYIKLAIILQWFNKQIFYVIWGNKYFCDLVPNGYKRFTQPKCKRKPSPNRCRRLSNKLCMPNRTPPEWQLTQSFQRRSPNSLDAQCACAEFKRVWRARKTKNIACFFVASAMSLIVCRPHQTDKNLFSRSTRLSWSLMFVYLSKT